MKFGFKQITYGMVVLLMLATTIASAAEEQEAITGHIYCILPTAEGIKLEPGICPGGEHAHVLKTPSGQLLLLQETPDLEKGIPRLTAEEKKSVTIEGRRIGRTVFNPEAVKWPWLNK